MNARALAAEFLGTFALCFVGIGSLSASPDAVAVAAFAHGFVIAGMGTAFGPISGGHFNPAVSLGMCIGRQITVVQMFGFWFVQMLGGIAGAFVVSLGLPESRDEAVGRLTTKLPLGSAVVLEGVGTFLLVMAVFGCSARRAPKLGALPVGLALTALILAIGPSTGCGLNPARWIGPELLWPHGFENPLPYVLGPLVGAAFAGLIYPMLAGQKSVEDLA